MRVQVLLHDAPDYCVYNFMLAFMASYGAKLGWDKIVTFLTVST